MNICFAMVLSHGYIDMARVFLYSLHAHGNVNDIPLKIIFCKEGHYQTLDKPFQEIVKKFWDNIEFIEIDFKNYENHAKWYPRYWSHEVFNIKGYDKVIFFDSDLLCLPNGGIRDLLDYNVNDIAMCREKNRNTFNAGLIIVGKRFLNDETFTSVLNHQKNPEIFGSDQAVYNEYFASNIVEMDRKYNTLVTEADDLGGIKLLHYIIKPNIIQNRDRMMPALFDLWQSHLVGALKIA